MVWQGLLGAHRTGLSAMMTEPSSRGEPEPVDAEFEPASSPRRAKRSFAPPPLHSRRVTFTHLTLGCAAAASLGAVMAIVVNGANSGASTGTLAREIDLLTRGQSDLAARADQVSADIVAIRARVTAQTDRLAQQDASDQAIRTELSAVSSQMSALIGAGDGGSPVGATANSTPLGALLARITRIETTLAESQAAPQTTRQMQRAIADLTSQVANLQDANASLSEAFNKRQLAVTALETSLRQIDTEMIALRGAARPRSASRPAAVAGVGADIGGKSGTTRALSDLETAAQAGQAFGPQQQALAAMLPQDVDVAALYDVSLQGAPTLDKLRSDLDASARGIEAMAAGDPDDGLNWLRWAIAGKEATPRGDSAGVVAQRLAQARRSLDAGDIRGAIASIDTLTGAPAAAYKIWRDQAERRADLDDRLRMLNQKLVGAGALGSEG
jgi:hypothetical protein